MKDLARTSSRILSILICLTTYSFNASADELYNAINNNDLNQVKALVSQGADINRVIYHDGSTPLILSAYRGYEELVDLLLTHSAEVDKIDNDYYTAIAWAWKEGHLDIFKKLVINGANIDVPLVDLEGGYTFLHSALRSNIDVAKLLLNHGANYLAEDKSGNIPLCSAGRSYSLAKAFINRGAKLNAADKVCLSILSPAVNNGDIETLRFLLDNGAKSSVNDGDIQKRTPLYNAAVKGNFEIVKLLLDLGADPNIPDQSGGTPLNGATMIGSLEIMKMLIDHGADVNAKETLYYPLNTGRKLKFKSLPGHTPLHAACEFGHLEAVKLLVNNGADLQAKATGLIVHNEKNVWYKNLTPIEVAQLHEKYNPTSRKSIIQFLNQWD